MEQCEPRRLFVALTAVPALHSYPTATAKLYLDFNGSDAITNWLGTDIPATPAFDRDGDTNDFSAGELASMTEVWRRVSEKYSPFRLDVTTVDPGNMADKLTAVIVLGGDGDWLGQPAGGVAPLGGFFNFAPNVGFVFTDGGVFTNKSIAEAATHEAGHLFDLEHHSLFFPDGTKDQEYDPGNFLVAPNMGVSYYADRGVWDIGPSSPGPTAIQDDLALLTNSLNGFGYRVDDYGGTLFSGTPIAPTTPGGVNFSYPGVIERNGDVDAFTFNANAGTLSLSLDVAPFGAMLDGTIKVFNAFGGLVAQSATGNLGETLVATNIPAGTYVIAVSGAGAYGDLGQYTLTGTLPGGGIPPSSDHLLIQGTDGDDNINITFVDNTYRVDVNGTLQTIDPNTIKQFDILAGGGNDVVTLGPGVCKAYVLGGAGADTITGGDFADTITASGGNDIVYGQGGDDRLTGSAGHDILVGGDGRDRLYGEAGNDQLIGGAGVDRMWGGDDHDVLSGQSSADKMYGEAGNDSIFGGNGGDILNGGDGLDYLWGGGDNDVLYSRDFGFDFVNGGTGDDSAQVESEDVKEELEVLLA
jgi:Ca2+-binding RTX toxin-like protein